MITASELPAPGVMKLTQYPQGLSALLSTVQFKTMFSSSTSTGTVKTRGISAFCLHVSDALSSSIFNLSSNFLVLLLSISTLLSCSDICILCSLTICSKSCILSSNSCFSFLNWVNCFGKCLIKNLVTSAELSDDSGTSAEPTASSVFSSSSLSPPASTRALGKF